MLPPRWFLLVVLSAFLTLSAPARSEEETPMIPEGVPEADHRATPIYPDVAWRAGFEGMSVMSVRIGVTGRPERVEIHVSSPVFDDAARAAAWEWSFSPFMLDGVATPVWVRVPFRFRLDAPQYSARVRADTLWSESGLRPHAAMAQQRERLVRRIESAREVWIFHLKDDPDYTSAPATLREKFARRVILEDLPITAAPLRQRLRNLFADPRTHGSPRPNRCENVYSLGIRFLSEDGIVDALISLCDRRMLISDGERLWSGSVDDRWPEWVRIAHESFPKDPTFSLYANLKE